MKKKRIFTVFALCCAFAASTSVWAASGDGTTTGDGQTTGDGTTTTTTTATAATPSVDGIASVQAVNDDRLDKLEKVISLMPKVSGYLQTGYNWGDKNGDNRSSFQMKRMRLFLDKKMSDMFDFRAQFEVFSGSTDGTPYKKKVMTVMDAYATAHFNKALHVRAGQYFLPLGFENYDISPATLEVVDFSNICYRMVCRNAVSSPNLIDYGRDIGVMAYGDLFENKDEGFSYLSYNLSLTNGSVITLNDDNKSKDVVARLTFRPIEKLRIMGSYNWGEYEKRDNNNVVVDTRHSTMNRFVAGAWYFDPEGLSLRSEYGHIQSSQANVKEDGLYVLAAYRVNKFLPVVRWDMYRDKENKTSANNRDNILIGCSYDVIKDFKIQANYIHSIYTSDVKNANIKDGSGNSIQLMCVAKF